MSSFSSEKSTFYETDSDLSIIHENLISQIAKIINRRINKNEEKDDYIKLVIDNSSNIGLLIVPISIKSEIDELCEFLYKIRRSDD